MTKRLPPRAILFRRNAEQARFDLAATTFDVTAVFERLAALSSAGELTALVSAAKPYDLRDSPPAKVLIEKLREEGFRADWEQVTGSPGVPPHHGLRIDWGPPPAIR